LKMHDLRREGGSSQGGEPKNRRAERRRIGMNSSTTMWGEKLKTGQAPQVPLLLKPNRRKKRGPEERYAALISRHEKANSSKLSSP